MLGIFNTVRDNSIYKVTALIDEHEFDFSDVNWDFST